VTAGFGSGPAGLERQRRPKPSTLSQNGRKRLGYHTPAEAFAKLLADDQRVATTP
jgi:hypothetical protein